MTEKGKRQQRYSEEFKFQATKLVVEGGTTYHRAAAPDNWASMTGPCVVGSRASARRGTCYPRAKWCQSLTS